MSAIPTQSSPSAPPSPPSSPPAAILASSASPPADDPLSLSIKALLNPHISQTTEKLWVVHQSQLSLTAELDRLISQLRNFLDNSDPPALRPLVVKLATVGKRLAAVNDALQVIQQRVNRIYLNLSKQRAGGGY